MGGVAFNLETDIPDLSGKVILITGGTTGLGLGTIHALASAPHPPQHIYFSGRNTARATAAIASAHALAPSLRVTFLPCDLGSLASVQAMAQTFLASSSSPATATARLDILMCNAGIMATAAGLSEDGYEIQFATNHLGHALLIKLLLPTLLRTAACPSASGSAAGDARIVILTSLGFRTHPAGGIAFAELRTPMARLGGGWVRYGQSKLAGILYAAELGRRYGSVRSVAVHPGVIGTELVGRLSWAQKALVYVSQAGKVKGVEEGVRNQVWAAVGPGEEVRSGGFYEPVGVVGGSDKCSRSEELAGRLWEWTETQLEAYRV
ncbi:hypothetical protein MMC19_007073 [Ptychographa xylographoides]|nr:hypothetical protein [Ptychographa xylographoides]